MPRRVKQDWSRPLKEPIQIGRKRLRTLDDVRGHLRTLPEQRAYAPAWLNVGRAVTEAAEGGDLSHVSAALYFARQLEQGIR